MKTLLFARTMQHARVDYLDHVDPADRRDVIVILRPRDQYKALGLHRVAFCFLDEWWLDWSPVDAAEAYNVWPRMLRGDRMWEINDVHRANHARILMGMPRVNQMVTRYSPLDTPERHDNWSGSRREWRYDILRKQGANALPGLDDKRKSKNPVGGIVFKEIFDIEDPEGAYPLYADWYIRRNIRQPETYLSEADRVEKARARRFREQLAFDYMRMQLAQPEPDFSLLKGFSVV